MEAFDGLMCYCTVSGMDLVIFLFGRVFLIMS